MPHLFKLVNWSLNLHIFKMCLFTLERQIYKGKEKERSSNHWLTPQHGREGWGWAVRSRSLLQSPMWVHGPKDYGLLPLLHQAVGRKLDGSGAAGARTSAGTGCWCLEVEEELNHCGGPWHSFCYKIESFLCFCDFHNPFIYVFQAIFLSYSSCSY